MTSQVKPKVLLDYSRYKFLLTLEEQVRNKQQKEANPREEEKEEEQEEEEQQEESHRRASLPEQDNSLSSSPSSSSLVTREGEEADTPSSSVSGLPLRVGDVMMVFEGLSKRLHKMANLLLREMERKEGFTVDSKHVLYYKNERLGDIKELVHGYLINPEAFMLKYPHVYDLFRMVMPRRIHHKKSERAGVKQQGQEQRLWYKLQ